jgi:hypothetical protein
MPFTLELGGPRVVGRWPDFVTAVTGKPKTLAALWTAASGS